LAGVTFGEAYDSELKLNRILAFTDAVENVPTEMHRSSSLLSEYISSGDLLAISKLMQIKNSTEGGNGHKTNFFWSVGQSKSMDITDGAQTEPKKNAQDMLANRVLKKKLASSNLKK